MLEIVLTPEILGALGLSLSSLMANPRLSLRDYIGMQYRIILSYEHFCVYYVLRGTLYLYDKTNFSIRHWFHLMFGNMQICFSHAVIVGN